MLTCLVSLVIAASTTRPAPVDPLPAAPAGQRFKLVWHEFDGTRLDAAKWAGNISTATLPDEFLVDSVRVHDLVREAKQA